MKILYGGAFNPPTKAHFQITKYLLQTYPNATLTLLPTNDFYAKESLVSFEHRLAMVKLMQQALGEQVLVSDFENTQSEYRGTYFTLRHFNHPYFVLGADAFREIEKWIRFPDVAIENKFLIIPRDGIDVKKMIEKHPLLYQHSDNFTVLSDFKPIDMSSSVFRQLKNQQMVLTSVYQYIKENQLYEVM